MDRRRPVGRRRFLQAAAALALGSGASACGTGGQAEGPLKFWNLFTGGDGARMMDLVTGFQRARPDIGVRATTLAWGTPYYTKLAMAAAGGRAPDVAVLHLSRLAGYAPTGLLDPFPEDLLAELGLTEREFPASAWQRARHDGAVYALPLDTHPLVLFHNTELCGRAGLLGPDGRLLPIRGEQGFLDACRRVKAAGAQQGLLMAVSADINPWRLFWTLYRQQGGQLFDPSGTRLVLDEPKALRALRFLRVLTVESGVSRGDVNNNAAVALFGNGQGGFFWNGEWELPTFVEQGLPFDVTPFPAIYDTAAVHGDSHALVLPHRPGRDPARTRAAVEFVRYLLRHSLTWAEGGHIPAYQEVARSEGYRELGLAARYASAAADLELDPPVWFGGAASDLQNKAGAVFSQVCAGGLGPEAAVAEFAAAMRGLLATPKPQA
ncbi:multiple sugar transport system substrate-binding protein [Crossiella equi]|uniref:Multiple sugar transport system substrate-binding protein n=1 Tax=Crossiella equi TaxID=130796 RepID=A0ABS5AQJ6_9PSEU|nr:extracellular solute-binding protein [Crossiella equi]MBP2477955.1 multiple sugar transport system substrate-binding protein [Crossiella equi]